MVHATYNNYTRGVLILIHKTISFQLINIIQDPQGRFVIAQGGIMSLALNLVSIYGPNEDNPRFLLNPIFIVWTKHNWWGFQLHVESVGRSLYKKRPP